MAYAPEPDLFVRTGGEQRVSNFLLWQLAYTELHFTDTLWPDFDAARVRRGARLVPAAGAPLRPHQRAARGDPADHSRRRFRVLTPDAAHPDRHRADSRLRGPRRTVPAAAAVVGRRRARRGRAGGGGVGAPRGLVGHRRDWLFVAGVVGAGLALVFAPAAGFADGWPAGIVLAVCGVGHAVLAARRAAVARDPLAARRRAAAAARGDWSCCWGPSSRWSSCSRARRGSRWRRWPSSGSPTPPRTSPAVRSAAASSPR